MNVNDNGGAFRKKKIYFSQVSNYALRDENLSLKAKGLYSLIQSYITIEGFVLYKNTLKKDCSEGNTAFESAWNELKQFGYLKQFKLKTPEGYFSYEYDLIDIIHTPENEGVDNLPSGKGGVSNKTNSNYTYSNNTYSNNNMDKCPDKSPPEIDKESLFDIFWKAYPKKQNKEYARKCFAKTKDIKDNFDWIMKSLSLFQTSKEWLKNDGEFIPHASTWLNGKRWEDYPLEELEWIEKPERKIEPERPPMTEEEIKIADDALRGIINGRYIG